MHSKLVITIMEVNSMKLDQTAPLWVIWLHIVYNIGYQNTSANNKADKKIHE